MNNTICWIDVLGEDSANDKLSLIYDQVRGPSGQLDNLYQGFSLRPHTIIPADNLYLAAMHHEDNTLPKLFSELIGTYVAILSACSYAEGHHGHNYAHLLGDKTESDRVIVALKNDQLAQCGDQQVQALLEYVKQLCLAPETIVKQDVDRLKAAGWSDGEVLEIVQVTAMFSYFVRVINGVGIQLGEEKLGLY